MVASIAWTYRSYHWLLYNLQINMRQYSQYNDWDIRWEIGGSILAVANSIHWLVYMLEDPGFKSWQEQDIYVFSKISFPVPAHT